MADTATTTASETAATEARAPASPRSAPSHRGAAVVAGVAGCLLLALGLPRLIAGVATLDARAVLWDVHSGTEAVQPQALAAASADLASAYRWVRDGELEGDRGLLLLRAADSAVGAERKELLAAATEATVASLTRAPGQPSVWLRLAHLRNWEGDLKAAVAALRMSMLSGSFIPALMPSRIDLALRLLPAMDREVVELLERQVRLMWVADPNFVARLGARPEAGPLVRNALAGLTEAEIALYVRLHGDPR